MVWFTIWIVHSQIKWLDPTASVLILYLVLKSVYSTDILWGFRVSVVSGIYW